MKTGLPKFDFNEGFFGQLGAMVSGAKEFPLDTATALYCCLLSVAAWDFDEGLVYVDMAEVELRFCEQDANEMAQMLVQKGWASLDKDWLILARIENGRIRYPFAPTKAAKQARPAKPITAARQPVNTTVKSWTNDPDFEELRNWLEDRHDAWANYLDGRKKLFLAEQVEQRITDALGKAYAGVMTQKQLLDYFYGLCSIYFEWTDAPAQPHPKDRQAADRLLKNDQKTLVNLVPFWLENCSRIKKDMTGDSISTFAYFYNQVLTLKSKATGQAQKTRTTKQYVSTEDKL